MKLEELQKQISHFKTDLRPVKDLIAYNRNAKNHPQSQIDRLAKMIQEFGFLVPCVVRADGTIAAGHGRVLAAQKLNLESVPCIDASHLTESQIRAFSIADNKIGEAAAWDPEMLALEFLDLKLQSFDLDLTGFGPKEISGLLDLNLMAKAESDAAVDDLLDAAEKDDFQIRVKSGDIWALGEHRVLCGDSTDGGQINMLMAGRQANMVLTDPPYNVAYEGKTKDKLVIANDSMGDGDFRSFLFKFYKAAFDITAPGGAIYVYHADSEGYNFRGAFMDAGWLLKQCLVWVKSAFVMGRQDYQWKHEPILLGWKPGAAHNWYGDRRQTTVLNYDRPNRNTDHPTPKPVEMLEYLIKNSSKQGDIIYDGFLGSGSTLIAAEQTQRVCYGSELSERYATVVLTRWEKLTGLKGERIFPPASHEEEVSEPEATDAPKEDAASAAPGHGAPAGA